MSALAKSSGCPYRDGTQPKTSRTRGRARPHTRGGARARRPRTKVLPATHVWLVCTRLERFWRAMSKGWSGQSNRSQQPSSSIVFEIVVLSHLTTPLRVLEFVILKTQCTTDCLRATNPVQSLSMATNRRLVVPQCISHVTRKTTSLLRIHLRRLLARRILSRPSGR